MTKRLWPTAAFALLALIVAGPLLGDGYLLLLDFPAGPHAARPSFLQLPSSGGTASVEPLVGVQFALERLDPLLPQRLFLVAPVLAGALGVYRLARRRFGVGALAAAYGGVLFVVNPFVYDRLTSGHLYLLVAYALLPWAVTTALAAGDAPPSRLRALAVGAWAAVLAAASVAVAAIYLLVALGAAAAGSTRSLRRRAELPLLSVVGAAAASAYWVLPAIVAPPDAVTDVQLDAYAPRPDGWAVLPTLAALYGFWRDEFPRAAEETRALYLLLLPIVALAALGFLALLERRGRRRDALVLGVGALVALVLAAGISLPATKVPFRWTYEHTPLLAPFREPQKLVALLALAYATLGAVGLEVLGAGRRPLVRLGLPIAAIAVALAYGHAVLWGLNGDVSLSHYPRSWADAARVLDERRGGTLLVLPRDPYSVWPFSDERIVAHPARSFFDRDVLAGETASLLQPSRDPFVAYVNGILAQRDARAVGRLLAPVDVRFVAVSAHDAVADDGAFLAAQRDLRRVFSEDGFVLYENTAWREAPHGEHELRLASPLVERHDLDLPRIGADGRIGPLGAPYVVTRKRCTDAWRLGDEPARCQLGAVAAFVAPARREPLWTPFQSVTIVGFAVSGIAIGGLIALGAVRHRR